MSSASAWRRCSSACALRTFAGGSPSLCVLPMRSEDALRQVLSHLRGGGHLTLFLDYDGTLVPIAPTPDEAVPDERLIGLLTRLAQHRSIRAVILSGRRLDDLRR